MTAMLEAIGTQLQTAGVGTLGSTLFLSTMPETPDACVAVYEYEGMQPDFTMGAGLYAIQRPRIQVKARGVREDYPGTRDKANAARDTLSAIVNQTLSGIRFIRIEPSGSTMPLGLDQNDRPMVVVNFQVLMT
jgi:hypothetical protein